MGKDLKNPVLLIYHFFLVYQGSSKMPRSKEKEIFLKMDIKVPRYDHSLRFSWQCIVVDSFFYVVQNTPL